MRRAFSIFVLLVWLLSTTQPVFAQENPVLVYYAGPQDAVFTALTLSSQISIVSSPQDAQVLVLNGEIPNPQWVAQRFQEGCGVLLIFGEKIQPNQITPLLGQIETFEHKEDPASLNPINTSPSLLLDQIVWTSAPQVRERFVLNAPALQPIVEDYDTHETILGQISNGPGNLFLLTASLENDANSQIQDWAYFNYLVYALVLSAADRTPLSFADYPASPVPHTQQQIPLFILLALIVLVSFTIFYFVRRYSKKHPEMLDRLIGDKEKFKIHEAGSDWEDIGFHRPLAGFMVALMFGLLLFIPLIIYQNLVLPVYILPSAQALGIWGRVTQFFNVVWLFFDFGTSMAFIKFFSQHRVHDPRRAVQYGQVFIWWQMLSGAIQVALVAALAGTVMPRTAYALYAWSVTIHTFIQIPGFYKMFRHVLMALQRSDFAQVIELAIQLIFPMITQPVIVGVMVAWGIHNPTFGMAMGGLFGMGLAAYATELLSFGLGFVLYNRLGYNSRVFFMAHFDLAVIKETFSFGFFEMLGSIAWGIGQALEVLLTQARLVNYAEIWGNWGLAQNFVFAFNISAVLYDGVMPGISEAISNGKRILSQYYTAMSYKYGGMISGFIVAVLLAVADRFILGASGPEFARGALYVIPLAIWGAAQYPSWVSDAVELAANRPYLKPMMVGIEQVIRLGLAWLLLAQFQIQALIISYFIGILVKDVVSYVVNHRVCFPHRFYFWQSLAAPLLATGAHYFILRVVTGWIWKNDQITSVIIFFIGIFLSYPLYAFLYGLAGGWDIDTLQELEHACHLSGFMKPFSMVFYKASALGAKISPLHNRFPITIRSQAMEEAKALRQERVDLV